MENGTRQSIPFCAVSISVRPLCFVLPVVLSGAGTRYGPLHGESVMTGAEGVALTLSALAGAAFTLAGASACG